MTEVLQYALLGVGAGAVYAMLGQGMVLIYRGSGILNLAHGAFAMAAAFLYYELHMVHGWALPVAMVVTVVVIALLGVVVDQVLLRRLRSASALARLIATAGVLLVLEAIGVLRYGSNSLLALPIFTPKPVSVLGATVSVDRLWLLALAAGLTVVLMVLWRFTRVGWVMAAVSENQRTAASHGWSPELVSAGTWALGAALAAIAGIFIAPIVELSVSTLSLLVIPALAAALLGGFESFLLALVGGVLIGVLESEISGYVTSVNLAGASSALPFVVIALVLVVRGSALPLRGYISDRPPMLGLGRINLAVAAPAFAAAVVLISLVFSVDWVTASMVWLSVGVILLSVVVLTGYAGQLSLAQYALAGIGALIAARLVQGAGWSFVPAALAGVLGTIVVGLVFALPALRTRGVELAVVTLGLGVAAQELLFDNASITGTASGTPVGSPHLFGLDIDGLNHPVRYALFALVLFTACTLAVANLRRGRSGRRMIAVRANERAAASMGINVLGAKLHAFALAGGLAGLGGIMLAFQVPNVVYDGFNPIASIDAIALAVIGGIGYAIGPLLGAIIAQDSIGQTVLGDFWSNASQYLALIGGGALLVTLVVHRDGLVNGFQLMLARVTPERLRSRPARYELQEHSELTRVTPRSLEVSELTVRYGGVTAVDHLALRLEPGEIVGLIGPNGAGKTSVIDAIAGFTRAAGEIVLGGERIDRWPAYRRARAGLVRSFQSLELFEDMSLLENMATASDRRDRRALLTDLIAPGRPSLPPVAVAAVREFGLLDSLDRMPTELSQGERRLAAIARAVAAEPSILLLDEPVAGLDEDESREIATVIRRLASTWGIAVLVVEHDMDFVMGICDRIVVVDFGRRIAAGSPTEIQKDTAAIAAYLGEDPGVLAAAQG